MTRFQQSVLWTLAACVFGYIAVHILIVKVPVPAQAQQPATDPTKDVPLPEEDRGGLGAERAAPAPALEPARVLNAVCVDKGKPLDDVIVDIFRQTPGESVFDPRVESFGRTKTTDDGKFSVTLPRLQGRTAESETAAKYILYFTAPGRPIKSLIVVNGAELPQEIVLPRESTEEVYLPTHHLVVAKSEGISVSPMLSAVRGFSKDGQPIRVAKLVDHRNEGKTPESGYSSSMGMPGGMAGGIAGFFPSRGGKRIGTGQADQQAAQERIRSARSRLTDAKTDAEKQAALTQLRMLLAEIFTHDMQMREKLVVEIESRLAKLREQYQAREKVKDEIIDLQLKVIEQDAAGLGFPGGGSFAPTPASGAGASTFDRGGGLRAEPAPEGPFPGGSNRVDKHDPIPRERTLDDVKKTRPAEVAELKNRGHFIESSDGRVFAYANIHQRSSSSHIRIVDSATGKLIGTATVGSMVGPLQFTDEGIASREGSQLELRIPLRRRKGPEGDVYEPAPATEESVIDRIKALGLKLGHEMKTSLDRRYPMRITGKEGEVTIKAGETKLIELPKPTLAVQWQCGDFKPEAVDDVEPFDYVLVEWNSDGHVTWSCYRSPAASTLDAGR